MNESNLLPAVPELDPDRALVGKIARLPADLREQLNQRLFDGQRGEEIILWLNALPPVKEMLAAQFDGQPITKQNLSYWRANGYQRWLSRKQNAGSYKDLRPFVDDINQAGVVGLTPATAALASGKILEFLQNLDPAKTNPAELAHCAAAIGILREKEQNDARIKIANMRLRQRDMQLLLKRDQQQRDAVAIALRVLKDARAKAVEASSWSNAEKIEALGIHLYGHLWEPRPVPVPTPTPDHPQSSQVQPSPT